MLKNNKNKVDISFAKANIAKVYAEQNKNVEAVELLEESEEIIFEDNDLDQGNYYKDYTPMKQAKEKVSSNYESQNSVDDEIKLRQNSDLQLTVTNNSDPDKKTEKPNSKSNNAYLAEENRKLGEAYLKKGDFVQAIPQIEKINRFGNGIWAFRRKSERV